MRALWKTALPAALAVLAGCWGQSPQPASSPAPSARAAQAPAAAPAPAPAAPAATEPEPAFSYQPAGLRDPFEPFIRLDEPKTKAKPQVFVPRTPLQRYALEEIRLVGVMWAEGGRSVALVEDPEGKGYVVSGGVLIGDRGGRIIGIRPDRVDVEERFVDLFGEENVKVMTMTLRKPEGEVNP